MGLKDKGDALRKGVRKAVVTSCGECGQDVVKEIKPRAARKQSVGKSGFLEAFGSFLRSQGYAIYKDGRRDMSRASLWSFYKVMRKFEVALAASAGMDVSLSGLGVSRFVLQGRSEKGRFRRYKCYTSSAVNEAFRSYPSLVYQDAPETDEEFTRRMREALSVLGVELGEDAKLSLVQGSSSRQSGDGEDSDEEADGDSFDTDEDGLL